MGSKFSEMQKYSPISTILSMSFTKNTSNIIFNYSKYINGVPGSGVTKSRTTREISILKLSKKLKQELKNLNNDEELAIHSQIKINNQVLQIPLIDFSYPTEEQLVLSIENLQNRYNHDIYIFKTGRSFHGYIDTLLNHEEWEKFLGELLLLNTDSLFITDSRWIGHSLKQKFSSLRITCNTTAYNSCPIFWKKMPKKDYLQEAGGDLHEHSLEQNQNFSLFFQRLFFSIARLFKFNKVIKTKSNFN